MEKDDFFYFIVKQNLAERLTKIVTRGKNILSSTETLLNVVYRFDRDSC